jgi:hypothetical protein
MSVNGVSPPLLSLLAVRGGIVLRDRQHEPEENIPLNVVDAAALDNYVE